MRIFVVSRGRRENFAAGIANSQLIALVNELEGRNAECIVVDRETLLYDGVPLHASELGVFADDIPIGHCDGLVLAALPLASPGPDIFSRGPIEWPEWLGSDDRLQSKNALLHGALVELENAHVPMVNSPSAVARASNKPAQLALMSRLGLPVPRTCITTSPECARRFIATQSRVIIKPVADLGAVTVDVADLAREEFSERLSRPQILQSREDGDDIRVTVVAGEIVSSVAIETGNACVDYRASGSYTNGREHYRSLALTSELRDMCIALARALGLNLAGIDLKLSSRGRARFLECNAAPLYHRIEAQTAHPITERVADCFFAKVPSRIRSLR